MFKSFKLPLVLVLALLLSALGLFITWMKVDRLHFPLRPGMDSEVWTIEARIEFTGRNGPARVTFALPQVVPGFTRIDESFVSRAFGLTLTDEEALRDATWTLRRSQGDQALFYRLHIYPERNAFRNTLPAEEIDDFPEVPMYPEPLASAVTDVLARARSESADIFTFASRLLALLADDTDENIKVIRDSLPRDQWEQLVTEILAGARIPSRVVYGVSLQEGFIEQPLIPWIEVNNGQRWSGFNPQTGEPGYPARFFPWMRDARELASTDGVRNLTVNFSVSRQTVPMETLAQQVEGTLLTGLMNFSLYSLPIATQEVYKVLLMVPLGALVVAFMRVVIGLPTFGTFTPILIALAFRETQIGWGVMLFVIILVTGCLVRGALANLRLLLVPRLACMLVVVIGLMVFMSLLSQRLGFAQGLSIALFPMVILTMTIERMSIVWEERGGWETFKETLGTMVVAVCGFFVMNHYLLEHLMFNFPELLLVLLGVCLLFGNYSGYRLSEILRFRDLSVPKY
jgi:hypothetical protein